MKSFSELPLKWKLVALFLLISIIGILLTGTFLIFNDLKLFQSSLTKNIKVLTKAIGANSRASLIFNDPEAAHRILSSFNSEPQVKYSALIDAQGEIFAAFGDKNYSSLEKDDPGALDEYFPLSDNTVRLTEPLTFKGKSIGKIFVIAELTEYEKIISNYYHVAWGVFAFSVFISFFLALKLQGIISEPIIKLSRISKDISVKADYSIRADIANNHDEIMDLYFSFNEMLGQIEKRDKELSNYKEHLESRVLERTQEIALSNQRLHKEVEERQAIQKDLRKLLDDKEILLKELNHRAKNNMQIISSMMWLQAAELESTDCANKFIECGTRIRSMALVHERIFNSEYVSKINFADYLNDLSSGLINTFDGANRNIEIKINSNRAYMDIDRSISCGLIVNELITNSLKHAFPGNRGGVIEVEFTKNSKQICQLCVFDNGVGFSDRIDVESPQTLGLELVKSITEGKLNGKFQLIDNEKTGFKVTFNLN